MQATISPYQTLLLTPWGSHADQSEQKVLILLPKLKQGEPNLQFKDFYSIANYQSQYPLVTISTRVYYQINGFVSSNPEATSIACGLDSFSDISQKFGSDGAGIMVRFPNYPTKTLPIWSYMLHDNYAPPLQLWSSMEYNIDFFNNWSLRAIVHQCKLYFTSYYLR